MTPSLMLLCKVLKNIRHTSPPLREETLSNPSPKLCFEEDRLKNSSPEPRRGLGED